MTAAQPRPPGHRSSVVVSFLILFGTMAGYALLETARDALFLSHLPATQLPWTYLLTAAVVSLVAWLVPSQKRTTSARTSSAVLVGASAVSVALYAAGPTSAPGLYALYSCVGVAGTLMIVHVWTLISGQFTIAEARRTFAIIASGGALGAMAGSTLAARIAPSHGPLPLIAVAAAVLGVTSIGPLALRPPVSTAPSSEPAAAPLRSMVRTQYARRIFWMVALITIATTLADFVFKGAVAASRPPSQLGSFFAKYQLMISSIELIMQLVIAPILLRRVAPHRLVLALPALLSGASIGLAIVPGLFVSLILKGIDGGLRNPIHRTSTEVLYLPLPFELRARFKTIADGMGQRGAQAAASLLALGVLALGATMVHLAAVIAVSAALCVGVAVGLQRRYVGAFRDQILEGKLDGHIAVPELDLESVGSLLAMLDSPSEVRVLAALETLQREGQARLIPSALIDHHSASVAAKALEVLSASGRRDIVPLAGKLLDQPDAGLRATASRVRAEAFCGARDLQQLRRLAADPRPEVHAAAVVALFRLRAGGPDQWQRLQQIVGHGSGPAQLALLSAIERLPHPSLTPIAAQLAQSSDPHILVAAARALSACGEPRASVIALGLLGVRSVREEARNVLLSAGSAGIELLARALHDPGVELDGRRHVPRTLSRFGTERAAAILIEGLARHAADGVTRYKMLRGLGRMRNNCPGLRFDRQLIERLASETIDRSLRLRRWRASCEADSSTAGALLKTLLARKERMAVERLFRFLDLLRPREEMERVFDALAGSDRERRAISREVLEYLLPPALRARVLALIDDSEPATASLYSSLLEMRQDHSAALRTLAVECAREHLSEVSRAS